MKLRLHQSLIVVIVLTAAAFGQQPAATSEPATHDDIKHLFAVMHVQEQMRDTMQAMILQQRKVLHAMIKQRHPEMTEEQIEKSEASSEDFVKSLPLEGMLSDMIPVYQKHLTKSDVAAMVRFYSSATGQKLLREQPAMAAESMQAMSARIQKVMDEVMQRAERKPGGISENETSTPAAKPEQRQN
jgi:uncharacterized protein